MTERREKEGEDMFGGNGQEEVMPRTASGEGGSHGGGSDDHGRGGKTTGDAWPQRVLRDFLSGGRARGTRSVSRLTSVDTWTALPGRRNDRIVRGVCPRSVRSRGVGQPAEKKHQKKNR